MAPFTHSSTNPATRLAAAATPRPVDPAAAMAAPADLPAAAASAAITTTQTALVAGPSAAAPAGVGRPGAADPEAVAQAAEAPAAVARGARPAATSAPASSSSSAEESMHGYQVMRELADRSGGVWRPSPGSIYPQLQQLQDEGLVSSEEQPGGRRMFTLTDEGRAEVEKRAGEKAPWDAVSEEVSAPQHRAPRPVLPGRRGKSAGRGGRLRRAGRPGRDGPQGRTPRAVPDPRRGRGRRRRGPKAPDQRGPRPPRQRSRGPRAFLRCARCAPRLH